MISRFNRSIKRHQTLLGVLLLFLLFLLAFSYAMFQGGFVSWFVFYSFLPVLMYSFLVLFYPLGDFKINRVIKKRELFSGETLHVTIEFQRRFPFPLFYLLVEDQLPNHNEPNDSRQISAKSKGLFSLGFNRKTTFSYKVEDMPRGEFHFVAIELSTGDLFGFIKKRRIIVLPETVIVYPKVQPLTKWTPGDQAFGGTHRSKKHFEHDLTSLSSIREYVPGDRLSWMDWKATARVNHLVTKQFEYPLNRDIVVVHDRFVDQKEEGRKAFETSASLAASLVERAIGLGASVGFISVGKESSFFQSNNQMAHKWVIFDHLARINPEGEGEAIYALTRYLQQLPHHATFVYVTTHLSHKVLNLFNEIRTRGLNIEIFYVGEETREDRKTASLLGSLEAQGITSYLVKDGDFNTQLKAGGHRAVN
jgi:uncharacterized protein (DUF58 family)